MTKIGDINKVWAVVYYHPTVRFEFYTSKRKASAVVYAVRKEVMQKHGITGDWDLCGDDQVQSEMPYFYQYQRAKLDIDFDELADSICVDLFGDGFREHDGLIKIYRDFDDTVAAIPKHDAKASKNIIKRLKQSLIDYRSELYDIVLWQSVEEKNVRPSYESFPNEWEVDTGKQHTCLDEED